MTQRNSGQDFDPKHRIIGALVVVTLAVIFIPMVLGERRENPAEPGVAAEETRVAVTHLVPVAARAPEPLPVEVAVSAPPASPPPASPKPDASAKEAAPAVKTAPATVFKAPENGWVVQVGTFTSAPNATRLERELRSIGYEVLNEPITLRGSKAVRLRVGPYGDKTAAVKAQERIRKSLGVKGVVLAYP